MDFLKLLVDRIVSLVVKVAGVTVQILAAMWRKVKIKPTRKRAKQMNGKTVAAAVVITMVLLVANKKFGGKLPPGIRAWLP